MSSNWPRTDGVMLSHACLAKLLVGYSNSNTRFGGEAPRQDAKNTSAPTIFGGPHTGGFAMAFGDGSVRMISHEITPSVHKRLSTRSGIDTGEEPVPSVW
jgi:prepilin-type processing-associated H-X9-DG protein